MNIRDALRVEGTNHNLLMCYGLFDTAELDRSHAVIAADAGPADSVFKLGDDDARSGVVLIEQRVARTGELAQGSLALLQRMISTPECRVAVMMLDGAFIEPEKLLEPAQAAQIFAFAFALGSEVIVLDDDLLASVQWKHTIAACAQRASASAPDGWRHKR